jgi:Nucleotidyl transferase AbiEii toxin, Type IV TA system
MTVGRTPPPTRATVEGRAYLDLRAIAKKSGRANDEYLRLYALEGFLLRLTASASSHDFVLKGGVLLAAYQLRRPTADIDFAALKKSNDVGAIKSMIITIADTQLPDDQDDGLWFDTSDTHAVAIRDEDAYSGVRVTLGAQLATARMRFHVDVNVGDPIWPNPQTVRFPRLLGGDITLLGYPISMVLAEKIVTASQRGITSTRWRDFADLYLIAGRHPLVAGDVRAPINEVATYRHAEIGSLRPALDGYPALAQAKWHAWRARQNLEDRLPEDFTEVLESVLVFTDGLFDTSRTSQACVWSPADRIWS